MAATESAAHDLVQRLTSTQRPQDLGAAAATLGQLAQAGPAACDALAAAGAVGPLLQLLRSSSAAVQRQAAWALVPLVEGSEAARAAVAAGGGIEALLALLGGADSSVLLPAAGGLAGVASYSRERCRAIAAAGAIPVLVRLCGDSSSGGSRGKGVQAACAGALANLCTEPGCKEAIVAAGGMGVLVCMLSDGSPDSAAAGSPPGGEGHSSASISHMAALAAVGNLLWQSPAMQAAAATAGVPAALVQLLRCCPDEQARPEALKAAFYLVHDAPPAARAAFAAAGGIAVLAEQLASSGSGGGSHEAVKWAAAALRELCHGSAERCSATLAAGCVPHLVQALHGAAGWGAATAAAGALFHLINSGGAPAGAAFVASAGVSGLVALLHGSPTADAVRSAAATVIGLACCCPAWPAAVAAVVPALERLCSSSADEEVRRMAGKARGSLVELLEPSGGVPAAQQAGGSQEPEQRPPRVCAAPGCGATAHLRRCGGCGAVRYCSPACSKAHWRAHKAECRRLQAERAARAGEGSGSAA